MTDLAAIRDAAALLRGVVHRTPLTPSATFTRLVGAPVHLKTENLQRSGSFKIRGAYVRIQRLGAAERGKGVVAASAGNHQLEVPVMDRPGALKALLAVVAEQQANVVSLSHDRLDPPVPVDHVEVYLTLETRDAVHARSVLEALRRQGYRVRRRAGPAED